MLFAQLLAISSSELEQGTRVKGGWRHSEAMSQDTVDRMNSAAVRPALKAQDAMETESLSVHSSELTAGEGLKKDTSWSRIRSHP